MQGVKSELPQRSNFLLNRERLDTSISKRRLSKLDIPILFNKSPVELNRNINTNKLSPDRISTPWTKYVAYSTPRLKKMKAKCENRLDNNHQELNKKRLAEAKFKKLMISKVQHWTQRKSYKHEEFVRNRQQGVMESANLTPDPGEEFFSDEEDFAYSFGDRIGSVRRKQRKVIQVSRKPDYFGIGGYISMQPHSFYSVSSVQRAEHPKEVVIESFRVKKALADRDIPFPIHQIIGNPCPPLPKALPKGGEMLLKAL